jgi:hypothetical protein
MEIINLISTKEYGSSETELYELWILRPVTAFKNLSIELQRVIQKHAFKTSTVTLL